MKSVHRRATSFTLPARPMANNKSALNLEVKSSSSNLVPDDEVNYISEGSSTYKCDQCQKMIEKHLTTFVL